MFPRAVVCACFLIATAVSAQHLGETREAIVARNGPAIEENHSKGTAIYRRGSWKIEVGYTNGIAGMLKVTGLNALSEDAIRAILESNKGGAEWHELSISGPTRRWQRTDLATASCARANPRSVEMVNTPLGQNKARAISAPSAVGGLALRTLAAKAIPPHDFVSPTHRDLANGLVAKFFAAAIPLVLLVGLLSVGGAVFFKVVLPWLGHRLIRGTFEAVKGRRAVPPPLPVKTASEPSPRSPPPLCLTVDDLEWEDFELVAGEVFRRQGFVVEIGSGLGSDGGKDLVLRRNGETIFVQCKCFAAANKVSVMAVREFYGLIVADGARRGIFMTTGMFSRDAREFAEGKPIELLARREVEQMIANVRRSGENLYDVKSWVDEFVAGARVCDPTCPRCRTPMKLRRGATGSVFWGCSSFPRCRGKREARTELVQAFSYRPSHG